MGCESKGMRPLSSFVVQFRSRHRTRLRGDQNPEPEEGPVALQKQCFYLLLFATADSASGALALGEEDRKTEAGETRFTQREAKPCGEKWDSVRIADGRGEFTITLSNMVSGFNQSSLPCSCLLPSNVSCFSFVFQLFPSGSLPPGSSAGSPLAGSPRSPGREGFRGEVTPDRTEKYWSGHTLKL